MTSLNLQTADSPAVRAAIVAARQSPPSAALEAELDRLRDLLCEVTEWENITASRRSLT